MIDNDAFIHEAAIVEQGATIGNGTRVWAFSHVLPGARIGAECNICDHTFIENEVELGDRVTIKSGVYLWDGLVIESDVFIGPAAVFTNDKRPRSKVYPESYPVTRVRQGCSIGANATVLPGLELGKWSMIAAGSLVTRNVKNHSLVVGSPARHIAWVCRCGEQLSASGSSFVCDVCQRKYAETPQGLVEE